MSEPVATWVSGNTDCRWVVIYCMFVFLCCPRVEDSCFRPQVSAVIPGRLVEVSVLDFGRKGLVSFPFLESWITAVGSKLESFPVRLFAWTLFHLTIWMCSVCCCDNANHNDICWKKCKTAFGGFDKSSEWQRLLNEGSGLRGWNISAVTKMTSFRYHWNPEWYLPSTSLLNPFWWNI